MPYGTIKIDTITFTDAGVDKSIAVSGFVQNPTFTGNVTVTGTISGTTVRATTVSGVTVSGTTANFASGVYTTQISGAIVKVPAGTPGAPTVQVGTGASVAPGFYSPATDQLGISTGGTFRLVVDSTGRVGIGTASPAATLHAVSVDNATTGLLSGATNAIRFVGHNTGVGGGAIEGVNAAASAFAPLLVGGSDLRFAISGTERARIDSSGRFLVGTSSAISSFYGTVPSRLSISTGPGCQLIETVGAAHTFGSRIDLYKTRGATSGSAGIVQNNDEYGSFTFGGSDGVGPIPAAAIYAQVDGTPGTNDMPGRLVFSTTADGAASPTERLRITNDGVQAYNQPAPAAVNATATLTAANLKAGIITSTSAAATDMTLPTGTDTQAGFSGTYDNMTFEWSVINTGPSLVRVLAGTAHTVVGSGSVATGTSGRFASRRTAANTFVTYRLA